MASIKFYSNYFINTLPLELMLNPVDTQESGTSTSFKLADSTKMTLYGVFQGSGFSRKGTVEKIEYESSSGKIFSINKLALDYDEFMAVVSNYNYKQLFKGNDNVEGSWQNDALYSGEGDDSINGLGGDDRIFGESGNDRLNGSWGNDLLVGGEGNDTLIGGAGTDILIGGTGDDTYVINDANDEVIEYWRQGSDTVETTLSSYTLGRGVENLVATGGGDFNGEGNWLDNDIRGSFGNDTLNGLSGNDTINGGNGNDTIYGGWGDDLLFGDAGADLVTTQASTDTLGNKPVSLTLTMPEVVEGSSVTVSGYVTNSRNNNSDTINLAFVLDVSGSMDGTYGGEVNVGDLNGDGRSNTLLDGAIASFERMIESIRESGLAQKVNVSLIPFESSARTIAQGYIETDANKNGTSDLIDAAYTLSATGGTSYSEALQEAISFFEGSSEGANHLFFISDGAPGSYDYDDELALLRDTDGINANIRSIALVDSTNYNTLDLLDDNVYNNSAFLVDNPSELEAGIVAGGYTGKTVKAIEIYKNGELFTVVDGDNLVETPFGMRYSSTVNNISNSGQDKIEAKLVFTDESVSPISTSQFVSSGKFESKDTLWGGAGDDYLDGGADLDVMHGGVGNDTYRVSHWGDKVVEKWDEGLDTVEADSNFSLTNAANVENLILLGSDDLNGQGNWLDNTIYGNGGNNTLKGLGGDDYIDGAGGNDTVSYQSSQNAVIVDLLNNKATGEGNDTLKNIENVVASNHDDIVYGDSLDNILSGMSGNDSIYGNSGNDTLIGGSGDDYLSGGYGIDTADYSSASNSIIFYGSTYSATVTGEGLDKLSSIENITGSRYNDSITFTDYSDNVIDAGGGSDSISAGSGDDIIIAGWGADIINGGSGNDTITYEKASSGVTVNLLQGTAKGLGDDVITNVENVIGSDKADELIGNDVNNYLYGGVGVDTLRGGKGNDTLDGGLWRDTMYGGQGNDTYIVDNINDQVVESDSGDIGGEDLVVSEVTFTLGANVEHLELSGVDDINGFGNWLDNDMDGNNASNILDGSGGDDSIYANDGDDRVNGGWGNDYLNGGNGIDTLYFNSGTAVNVNLSTRSSTGQGSDTIYYFENVEGTDKSDAITGDSSNNNLFGFGGDDSLDGGSGNDYLVGGSGNDSITGGYGNDRVDGGWGNDVLDGGSGFDTVDFSSVQSAVNVNLGSGTSTGQGVDSLSGFESVIGSSKSDTIVWNADVSVNTTYTDLVLYGMGGDDILTGSSGDDLLDGGTGADTMTGGEGNDTYYVDSAQDVVIENGYYDTDTVISSVGYSLVANVENLQLTGSAWLGEGNALNNNIRGTDTANALKGLGGSDRLVGAGGRDWLTGGSGADIFVYESASDSTVASSDVIIDFSSLESDKIDLSALDAIMGNSSSYDSFSFIGSAEFMHAGELRFETDGVNSLVQADMDGDRVADFEITLQGVTSLVSSDFIV